MLEKRSKGVDLSSTSEAQSLIRQIAEPRPKGENDKAAIFRLSNTVLRWSLRRVRAVWNAEAKLIRSEEMDKLRALARQQADRYSRIAQAMQSTDPEFYQSEIACLLSAARQLGGED